MKTCHTPTWVSSWPPKAAGLICCGLALANLPAGRAADGTEITAVSSRASDEYVRTKLPDGSFEVENYAFGEGGHLSGPKRDDTIDKLHFIDVARTIVGPLAGQNYLPTKDPSKTKLLIMVYWGTTTGTSGASGSSAYQGLSSANQTLANAKAALDAVKKAEESSGGAQQRPAGGPAGGSSGGSSGGNVSSERIAALSIKEAADSAYGSALAVVSAENRTRDKINWQNAELLGYDKELAAVSGLEFTALRGRRQDLLDEIEDDRYYVVLMAFDFQTMWKTKKHKLLWETRFSIRQRHNDFEKQLAAMTENASRYFGQDSHGLVRKPVPEGRVAIGDVKVIGVESK
jgi:hypothetical protein